jgi:hypothetical protein
VDVAVDRRPRDEPPEVGSPATSMSMPPALTNRAPCWPTAALASTKPRAPAPRPQARKPTRKWASGVDPRGHDIELLDDLVGFAAHRAPVLLDEAAVAHLDEDFDPEGAAAAVIDRLVVRQVVAVDVAVVVHLFAGGARGEGFREPLLDVVAPFDFMGRRQPTRTESGLHDRLPPFFRCPPLALVAHDWSPPPAENVRGSAMSRRAVQ